jgi:bifunctional non-homologous end joining protein LigD
MAKKKLASYQAKRDFGKTSEPTGKASIKRAKYPRFIIQKHAASRLHYDLRLEHDDSANFVSGKIQRSERRHLVPRGRRSLSHRDRGLRA